MRYVVGLAVSVWFVCISHGWDNPDESVLEALNLLVSLVSMAVWASSLCSMTAARRERVVPFVGDSPHLKVFATSAVVYGLSEILRVGLDIQALQCFSLLLCIVGMIWGISQIVLRHLGMMTGSRKTGVVLAALAATGFNVTLAWTFEVHALRLLAENEILMLGLVGASVFGILAIVKHVNQLRGDKPDVPLG